MENEEKKDFYTSSWKVAREDMLKALDKLGVTGMSDDEVTLLTGLYTGLAHSVDNLMKLPRPVADTVISTEFKWFMELLKKEKMAS